MKSILDMLDAIIRNPHLDVNIRTRAGFLHSRLSRKSYLGSILDGLL